MHRKGQVILCRNGICQHRYKVQVLIQLHKRQKHQTAAVMIHLRHIHNKRIEAHQGTGNPDIHNVGSTASACRAPCSICAAAASYKGNSK